jgi:sugar phosphate isomerase/epimerase
MNESGSLTRRKLIETSLKTAALGVGLPRAAALAAEATSKPAAKEMWQIGCYTRPWRAYDWRIALDAIAEAGFKHVGLMSTKSETKLVISTATSVDEAHRIGEEATRRGLEVASVYGGHFDADQSLKAGIAGLRKLVDIAEAAKSKTLLLGGTGSKDVYERYYKAVAEVCDYAADKKVGLVLKPHGGLNATSPQCRKTIERVGHKNFTLWYDPGNIYYYSNGELDPVEDARTVAGIVTGMCVKDFTMSVKDGKVDFPAVLAQLRKGGFTHGPLVIETLAPGDLPAILTSARKARRFVEALVA